MCYLTRRNIVDKLCSSNTWNNTLNSFLHRECWKTSFIHCFIVTAENLIWFFYFSVYGDQQRNNIYLQHCICCYLYTLWKINIFLGETQSDVKNLFSISQYSIFNQDNFQDFYKNPNLRLSFLLHMGQNLLLQWLLLCFI